MGDNTKSEVYRTMNEIIDDKVIGKYVFMSQGYLLYDITYVNKKLAEKPSLTKNL